MSSDLVNLASLTVDELLEKLADTATSGGLPIDPERKRIIGKALFQGWFNQIRDRICGQYENMTKSNDPVEIARDAAAVADLLLAVADQLPLATMSVLIVKYGLDALCGDSYRD